jgi:hypothetical protein
LLSLLSFLLVCNIARLYFYIGGFMSVAYVVEKDARRFICLSTDVDAVSGSVPGIPIIGSRVFFLDKGTEWIVGNNLKLVPYATNTTGGTSGSAGGISGSTIFVANLPATQSVSGSASEYHLGEIGGNLTYSSLEFTNSSGSGTAYIANDVVSGGSAVVTPYELINAFRKNGGSGYIVSLGISTDKSSVAPQFRVHFFNSSTAMIVADNLPYNDLYSDNSKKLKFYDLPSMTTSSNTSGSLSRAFDNTIRFPVVAGSATNSLYYALETLSGYQQNATERYFVNVIIDNN